MSQIELLCPECRKPFEVDDGFAGGVCRCPECDTIMSVPDDSQPAEHSARPDDPDLAAAISRPVSSTPLKGKKVATNKKRKKRKSKNAALAAVIFPALALVLLLLGFAIYTVFSDNSEPNHTALFAYDSNANPYTLPEANALGLPLAGRCAVIIDASSDSAESYDLMKKTLAAGLGRPVTGKSVFIAIATADGVETLAGSPTPITEITQSQLTTFLNAHAPAGTADLGEAAKRAGKEKVDQFIFITSRDISDTEGEAIIAGLASREAALIDAILIDGDSIALDNVVVTRGGTFANIKMRDLEDWAYDAELAE